MNTNKGIVRRRYLAPIESKEGRILPARIKTFEISFNE